MDPLSRFRLDGRTVIVTGASSGLGLGFAKALGAVGANVVLGARRIDLLEDVSAELDAKGIKAVAQQTDVSSPDDCERLAHVAHSEFGAIDVLVNNAGLANIVPNLSESPANFRQIVDVNLMGTYWMSQACARVMQEGSAIVNVSSLHGFIASRFPHAAYSASKAGLIGLTRDLASEWTRTRGIRVNALCPGYFDSEMTQSAEGALTAMVEERSIMGRFGRQEEVDSAMLFLASDASSYMTGATLLVDGGYSVV